MNIANWTITDATGTVWAARCHCGYAMSCAKALITSRPPKCKRCGSTAAKAVDKPVDKAATPQAPKPLLVAEPEPQLPRFGRLQVLGDAPRGKNSVRQLWTLCDCGNKQMQSRWAIYEGFIVSCG